MKCTHTHNKKKFSLKKCYQLFSYFLLLTTPILAFADPPPLDPDGINALSRETNGKSQVKINKSHGAARFVNIIPNQKGSLDSFKGATPKDTVDDFLVKHGKLFGINSSKDELKLSKSKKDNIGFTQIIYNQVYNGIPVHGGNIIANVNSNGELRSVNGRFIPKLNVATTPLLTVQKAGQIAIAELQAELKADDSSPSQNMSVENTSLVIFDPSISEDKPGDSHLAFKVRITSSSTAKDVFVDAQNGFILGKRELRLGALDRRLFDAQQADISSTNPLDLKNYPHKPYWVEGNTFPTTDPFSLPAPTWKSTNDALAATQLIYDLYNKTFGIDAPDGKGNKMDINMNYTTGNAFADLDHYPAMSTNFGLDLATDDVVGHEWQHWYTNFAGGGLDYIQQSGALHEAFSDIFGEVIDLLNIGMPFGGGDLPNAMRHDGTCALISVNSPEARTPKLIINSPSAIAQETSDVGLATFGPIVPLAGLTGDIVHVDDGSTALVSPGQEPYVSIHDGCQVPFLTDVHGKIALIKRGNCNFIVKVGNAESQGATGVIIYNREDEILTMGGSPPPNVTIPSMFIKKTLGESIVSTLATNTVNVTIKADQEPRYTDNSLRWLNGEDVGIPPGQTYPTGLRDLWDPTCLGLPGKVSDPQYTCGASDNGGAHQNMGVITHGFALAVDGGNYNGYSIGGLGLTKATHIYHRAQDAYQTFSMGFADHADALEQACADLVGVPLKALASNSISSDVIGNADCVNVGKLTQALELRLDPGCPVLATFASIAPVKVVEGDSGTTDMVFTVLLSAISPVPVTMDYEAGQMPEFNPATDAGIGDDFLPSKGTLVIPAGSQTGTITVKIKGDKKVETDEKLMLYITNVVNANAIGNTYGIIVNDD